MERENQDVRGPSSRRALTSAGAPYSGGALTSAGDPTSVGAPSSQRALTLSISPFRVEPHPSRPLWGRGREGRSVQVDVL